MKPEQKVKIINLENLPEWVRPIIKENPRGIIRSVFSDRCDVRTARGMWIIEKKNLEMI
jgi:hypothetical protein